MTIYFIPPRFENILNREGVEYAPLLVPVQKDLDRLARLAVGAKVRGSGQLVPLPGTTGVGKTSAVYSASVFLREQYSSVLRVPDDVPLRDLAGWIDGRLPAPGNGMVAVLIDGREVTDDTVGLSDLLTRLNQLLRRRADLLVFWPTNDAAWSKQLRDAATGVGGSAFIAADLTVGGPGKEQWSEVLERLLSLSDQNLERLGIEDDDVEQLRDGNEKIGDFLSDLAALVASRIDEVQAVHALPAVTFVVTSGPAAVQQANLLRRPTNFGLQPENVLHASRRSEAGRYWLARRHTPSERLAYISTLFQVRLVAVTASAVSYACLEHGSDRMKEAAAAAGGKRNRGNFGRVLTASELYKYVKGEGTAELTASPKGAMSEATLASFAAVQRLAAAYDHELNEAIVLSLQDVLQGEGLSVSHVLEVDRGSAQLFTDAVLTVEGDQHSLEFHHLSEDNCTAPAIAQYVMDKLRTYAKHYRLVPL